MNVEACPFCQISPERIFHTGRLVLGAWDVFPVTQGHALLIPRRHVETWADATSQERLELTEAISLAFRTIQADFPADGFNVGINLGEAAGQTVPHLHVHLIPRRKGDVSDPRGGIRHVIPAKGFYEGSSGGPPPATTERARSLVTGEDDPLLPELISALSSARNADIAVAFVLESGIERLEEHFRDLLKRGGRIRFLTGNYMDVTDPRALKRLLDLEGAIDRRVFETRAPVPSYGERTFATSFHPKAYIFHRGEGGLAFVGSSNLSRIALSGGVEWNYRVLSSDDSSGFRDVADEFDQLFSHPATQPLTDDWIDAYARERKEPMGAMADAIEAEAPLLPPSPHAIQTEALLALQATRAAGNSAGLVVLATGLGKTWLSAFDTDSPEFRRVLFVAHREEILDQARKTFRSIRPNSRLGRFAGTEKDREAEVLFASIQTLGRQRHLDGFAPDEFDYIVVDEFHHASAPTYRRLIEHFRPKFLLGLTATPERTDGGDLLALCQENLVYRRDLGEGIRQGFLAPFHYFGVPDEVDYRNIPWRSSRFDEEALTKAVSTQARALNALEQYKLRGGKRTLGFCVSTRHADFMAEFFRDRGVRAVAVHSEATSAPRTASLEQLESDELDIVFAVDMFNEGVDLPQLDTVMMLRPTESRILWMQQFGRGLRTAVGKEHLTVIDYIGNHRTFLLKPQTLLQLGSSDREVGQALDQLQKGEFDLPPGCEVTYDLEAVEILKSLLRTGKDDVLRRFYEDFRSLHGVRPTAVEVFHEGYNIRSLRPTYGSWFGFVRQMGDLDPAQATALAEANGFLESLETTEMTKSYKMLLLISMLNMDRFPGEIAIDDLAGAAAHLASRSAALQQDLGAGFSDPAALRDLLERNPIAALVGGKGTGDISYFAYTGGILRTQVASRADTRHSLQELTRELAEWRLAEYLERHGGIGMQGVPDASVPLSVTSVAEQPVLALPDRAIHAEVPEGWTKVTADGEGYEADFTKASVDVVRRLGGEGNVLPQLLRTWFGPDAGLPGTRHRVQLEGKDGAWTLSPQGRLEGAAQLWRTYMRASIPGLFGLQFVPTVWQQGFVPSDGDLFLLVTLDKGNHEQRFQYQDKFVSADKFQWQSQNRTTRASKHGQLIKDHQRLGIAVHLFVRPQAKTGASASPFTYCGNLDFESWEGDKPITVQWRLKSPVPAPLQANLGVFPGD